MPSRRHKRHVRIKQRPGNNGDLHRHFTRAYVEQGASGRGWKAETAAAGKTKSRLELKTGAQYST